MNIAVMTFRLQASWVHSLKEKRMVVQSLITRIRSRFHVSVMETGEQDLHQLIELGIAFIVPHNSLADRQMDLLSRFVEENTDAQILEEEREIR